MLKGYSRQYTEYNKIKTILQNNLISIIDQSFPDVNKLFTSPTRDEDGHQKWINFVQKFWHAACISSLSKSVFFNRYKRWCNRMSIITVSHAQIKFMPFQRNSSYISDFAGIPCCS